MLTIKFGSHFVILLSEMHLVVKSRFDGGRRGEGGYFSFVWLAVVLEH